MTKRILAFSNSSAFTMGSASLPTVDSNDVLASPQTRGADMLQWEEYFRPQDIPLAEGFEDIDTVVENLERDPASRVRLEAARKRMAAKLPSAKPTLAALRLQRGWSQKRLADAVGTSQPHIARIENGRDNVLLATANQLARALGVTLQEVNHALGFEGKHR